jgi:hypothetical protein
MVGQLEVPKGAGYPREGRRRLDEKEAGGC